METRFCEGQSSKGNNSKIINARVTFLALCHRLMLVDICMKFHDASLYGLKVIDRTRWRQDFVRDKVQRELTQKYKCKSYRFCTLHVV